MEIRTVADAAIDHRHGDAGTIGAIALRNVGTNRSFREVGRHANRPVRGDIGHIGIARHGPQVIEPQIQRSSTDRTQCHPRRATLASQIL